MGILRWGEFGEVVVRYLVEVKPGENLLIVADTRTDMDIAEACLIAGINAKANAQLLVIPRMSKEDRREVSLPSVVGAILGADVIVGVCHSISNLNVRAATDKARAKGARVTETDPEGIEDFLIEGLLDVDYELMIEVGERMCELFEQTEVCRVTSALGTDISFRLKGRPGVPGEGKAIAPGEWDAFPGGTPAIAPIEETINGTMVIDGTIQGIGRLSAPVTCRLEQGVITAIEGEPHASAVRSRLESTGEPEAYHMCRFNIGINPRARIGYSSLQDEMTMGAVSFGFGGEDTIFEGAIGECKMHTSVYLASPTVYLDGVVVCENNRLNPDLGLGGL